MKRKIEALGERLFDRIDGHFLGKDSRDPAGRRRLIRNMAATSGLLLFGSPILYYWAENSRTLSNLFLKQASAQTMPCVLNVWFGDIPDEVRARQGFTGFLNMQNVLLTPLQIQGDFNADGNTHIEPLAFALTLRPEVTFQEPFEFLVEHPGGFEIKARVIRQEDGDLCAEVSHRGTALGTVHVSLIMVSGRGGEPTITPPPIVTVPSPIGTPTYTPTPPAVVTPPGA